MYMYVIQLQCRNMYIYDLYLYKPNIQGINKTPSKRWYRNHHSNEAIVAHEPIYILSKVPPVPYLYLSLHDHCGD